MQITAKHHGLSGVDYIVEYSDADNFDHLEYEKCRQAYGVCFCGEDIVIGYRGKKDVWGLIGGTVEPGEKFEETLKREIQEESNMEVIKAIPVGYQKVIDTRDGSFVYQLRYACIVKPYGPFISDPAGAITKIALVHPTKHKEYFDWGKIGDRIIARAIELKHKLL